MAANLEEASVVWCKNTFGFEAPHLDSHHVTRSRLGVWWLPGTTRLSQLHKKKKNKHEVELEQMKEKGIQSQYNRDTWKMRDRSLEQCESESVNDWFSFLLWESSLMFHWLHHQGLEPCLHLVHKVKHKCNESWDFFYHQWIWAFQGARSVKTWPPGFGLNLPAVKWCASHLYRAGDKVSVLNIRLVPDLLLKSLSREQRKFVSVQWMECKHRTGILWSLLESEISNSFTWSPRIVAHHSLAPAYC